MVNCIAERPTWSLIPIARSMVTTTPETNRSLDSKLLIMTKYRGAILGAGDSESDLSDHGHDLTEKESTNPPGSGIDTRNIGSCDIKAVNQHVSNKDVSSSLSPEPQSDSDPPPPIFLSHLVGVTSDEMSSSDRRSMHVSASRDPPPRFIGVTTDGKSDADRHSADVETGASGTGTDSSACGSRDTTAVNHVVLNGDESSLASPRHRKSQLRSTAVSAYPRRFVGVPTDDVNPDSTCDREHVGSFVGDISQNTMNHAQRGNWNTLGRRMPGASGTANVLHDHQHVPDSASTWTPSTPSLWNTATRLVSVLTKDEQSKLSPTQTPIAVSPASAPHHLELPDQGVTSNSQRSKIEQSPDFSFPILNGLTSPARPQALEPTVAKVRTVADAYRGIESVDVFAIQPPTPPPKSADMANRPLITRAEHPPASSAKTTGHGPTSVTNARGRAAKPGAVRRCGRADKSPESLAIPPPSAFVSEASALRATQQSSNPARSAQSRGSSAESSRRSFLPPPPPPPPQGPLSLAQDQAVSHDSSRSCLPRNVPTQKASRSSSKIVMTRGGIPVVMAEDFDTGLTHRPARPRPPSVPHSRNLRTQDQGVSRQEALRHAVSTAVTLSDTASGANSLATVGNGTDRRHRRTSSVAVTPNGTPVAMCRPSVAITPNGTPVVMSSSSTRTPTNVRLPSETFARVRDLSNRGASTSSSSSASNTTPKNVPNAHASSSGSASSTASARPCFFTSSDLFAADAWKSHNTCLSFKMRSLSQSSNDQLLMCGINGCSYKTATAQRLMCHQLRVHEIVDTPLVCGIDSCMYITLNIRELKNHQRSQHQMIKFRCNKCSCFLYKASLLRQHLLVHVWGAFPSLHGDSTREPSEINSHMTDEYESSDSDECGSSGSDEYESSDSHNDNLGLFDRARNFRPADKVSPRVRSSTRPNCASSGSLHDCSRMAAETGSTRSFADAEGISPAVASTPKSDSLANYSRSAGSTESLESADQVSSTTKNDSATSASSTSVSASNASSASSTGVTASSAGVTASSTGVTASSTGVTASSTSVTASSTSVPCDRSSVTKSERTDSPSSAAAAADVFAGILSDGDGDASCLSEFDGELLYERHDGQSPPPPLIAGEVMTMTSGMSIKNSTDAIDGPCSDSKPSVDMTPLAEPPLMAGEVIATEHSHEASSERKDDGEAALHSNCEPQQQSMYLPCHRDVKTSQQKAEDAVKTPSRRKRKRVVPEHSPRASFESEDGGEDPSDSDYECAEVFGTAENDAEKKLQNGDSVGPCRNKRQSLNSGASGVKSKRNAENAGLRSTKVSIRSPRKRARDKETSFPVENSQRSTGSNYSGLPSGKLTYRCSQCHFWTEYPDVLSEHANNVHNNRRFFCDEAGCSYVASVLTLVKNHVKVDHEGFRYR